MIASVPPSPSLIEFSASGGVTLRGARWGAAEPGMVFMPGGGLPVQSYGPAFQTMADLCGVMALNPRGHGNSDVPPNFSGWESSLHDLRAFIETVMHPPVILAGHSFGAMLSLWLAAEEPGLVSGILLIDPLFPGTRDDPWPAQAQAGEAQLIASTETRQNRWDTLKQAEDYLRGRNPYQAWDEAAVQAYLEFGLQAEPDGSRKLACPPWVERAVYEGRGQQEPWTWVDAVRAPAAILMGKHSPVAGYRQYRDLADALPLAAVYSIDGSHTFPMESPADTGRALCAAYALIERSAGAIATGL